MNIRTYNNTQYIIVDPTKNITALVISHVPITEQPKVATELMKKEKSIEQVGFVSESDHGDITLRMAGGEFCGNAVMSIAAYYATLKHEDIVKIRVYVLDMREIIDVSVNKESIDIWLCQETISYEPEINYIDIDDYKNIPLVNLYGISHIIFTTSFDEKTFKDKSYERYIKKWCEELSLPALGFMFYDEKVVRLTPLVYVRKIDTLFWEKACASGTIAIGAFIADRDKKSVAKEIIQPGGILKVSKEKEDHIKLEGKVRFI